MGAIGGNQEIAGGLSVVGKGGNHATAGLLDLDHPLTKLHPFTPEGINQHRLQFSPCHRTGIFANLLHQRRHTEAGQGRAGVAIVIGHIGHVPAQLTQRGFHAQRIQAFNTVGPDGNRRADGLHLLYGFKDLNVNSGFLQRNGTTHAANTATNHDCFHIALLSAYVSSCNFCTREVAVGFMI
ncbi:Uncharacterised protein [Pantoea agglomerans]|nr:Uncharacterised protein [Pantoea agglomerans]